MNEHVAYWKARLDEGKVLVFGPVLDPKEVFGVALVEAKDEVEMRSLIANDPAVKAGVHVKDEFYPMSSRTFVQSAFSSLPETEARKLYAGVGIHHPKSSKDEAILLSNMRKFGESQKRHKGLLVTTAIKDQEAGMLLGISIWNSKGEFEAAWKELSVTESKRRTEERFRFEDHEDEPHKFYSGEEPS